MKQLGYKNIYLVTFLTALLIPYLGSLVQFSQDISDSERRSLTQAPDFPKNSDEIKNFPKRFENYFKDNFAFRNRFLNAFYYLKYQLRDSSGTDVLYGNKPGWLFYNEATSDPVGDYRNINQFSPEQLKKFVSNLKQKQSKLKELGINYIFVLTPSKHYIYPEHLPDHIKPLEQTNFKTQLKQELAKYPQINYLDLTNNLQHAKNEQLLYFKADTHWNYYAGNIAQYEIMKLLKKLLPESAITPALWPSDTFKFQWNHQGDLAYLLRSGIYFEEAIYKPEFEPCTDVDNKLMLSANSEYVTKCDNTINALVFHDSFFNLIQPYFSSQLNQVQYLKKRFTFKKANQYITNQNIDIVVEQMVDRFLPAVFDP